MIARLTKFGLAGLANTAAGLSVILLLLAAGTGDYLANAAGYLIGLFVSFLLNRRFTFGRRGNIRKSEILAYAAAVLVAYFCNLAVLTLGRHLFGAGSVAAQLVAISAYTATFYILTSQFVFAERKS